MRYSGPKPVAEARTAAWAGEPSDSALTEVEWLVDDGTTSSID
jgi:hypothetical protein